MSRWSRRRAVWLLAGAAGVSGGLSSGRRRLPPVGNQAPPVQPATPATASAGPGDVFLVLGDSLAAGIGASDPARRGVASILHGYLGRVAGRPVELANLAIPRETTGSFLEDGQLDAARRLIGEARGAGLHASPILVSLGANDLGDAGDDQAALESAIETVAANLDRVFTGIRDAVTAAAEDPTADLFALTYYDPTGSNPERPGSSAWWVARLNETIVRSLEQAGGRAPNLAPLFRGREVDLSWYPADTHPTNAGHAVIARAVWATMGYDAVAPVVTLLRPGDGPLPRPLPTIAATAEDAVGVEEVVALLDGSPLGELVYHPAAGAYLLLWDASALPPGAHVLEIRAADAAGNTGTAVAIVQATPDGAATPVSSPVVTPEGGPNS